MCTRAYNICLCRVTISNWAERKQQLLAEKAYSYSAQFETFISLVLKVVIKRQESLPLLQIGTPQR